ncbi:MAG TPA: wax ester/triacylglycerol synthase domain-containing protein [Nocardioides sp.]|nr:wax ester/triacylglycerol synthase domain-containing protein [Nocardioides sp.]
MERLTGPDAVMLHLERPTVPMHTLKIVVLDSLDRGRPITLAELRGAVAPYLGLVPRATQRVTTVAGTGGRPYWVHDPDFDLAAHLEEATLAAPTRDCFDELCARLAERHLDRDRPLWAMTLVHGLQDGHQAVVVRLHHAVSDGLGALNAFLAATTDRPGVVAPPSPAVRVAAPRAAALRRQARRELGALVAGVPTLVRAGRAARRNSRDFTAWDQVPGGLAGERTSFNARGGRERVCASGELELADLKEIARETGATINGVLHGVIAGAMRAEHAERGDLNDVPAVAVFGVAADTRSTRRWGNEIAPATVFLHTQVADPLERLRATARSCLHAVDLRRRRGFEVTDRLFTYVPRLMPALRAAFAPHVPKVVNNITTANVAGPQHVRWFGDVAVVDWISYAVAVAPADVNLTAYSYNGRLSIGLVATPEAMPDPAAFLARLQPALDEIRQALAVERAGPEVGALVA